MSSDLGSTLNMSGNFPMHINFTSTPEHQDPTWHILYRGPLSSCNYSCAYCPFAKTKNTRQELAEDAQQLQRFVDWVRAQTPQRVGILFTPWGEALIRKHYQRAFIELTHMSHVYKVAAQTNLSFPLHWLKDCERSSLALWTTYHPTELPLQNFVEKSHKLVEQGIRHSVGIVGMKAHFEAISHLRAQLNASVYMWINAYKREIHYYTQEELHFLSSIDPHFHFNTRYHPSLGESCRAGVSSFTVDGRGDVRRCHFISEPIGNIYTDTFRAQLYERTCTQATCGCHIGYVHLDRLQQYSLYQEGLLERIPHAFPS